MLVIGNTSLATHISRVTLAMQVVTIPQDSPNVNKHNTNMYVLKALISRYLVKMSNLLKITGFYTVYI